jgi:hypothetical protein
MAAAPSTRAWLPEMLEVLQKEWNSSLSWEQFGALCERLTKLRITIRKERGIKGPRMFCRHCNAVHEMELGPVTIRSGLFALRKRGVLTDEELKTLDDNWRKYRTKHRLDGCARKKAEPFRRSEPGDHAGLANRDSAESPVGTVKRQRTL